MAGIDTTHGKLTFPPRFVPYLEKHRIFELFHELAELLIQERPKDHVKFLKDVLPCAARRRDRPRIVFLAPPSFDREKFAAEVAKILGIPAITRLYLEMKERERRLLERLRREETMRREPSEEFSCVCLGEVEPGEYGGGYVLPESFGERSAEETFESTTEEVEEVGDGVPMSVPNPSVVFQEDPEDPCKGMRVCPCKEDELGDRTAGDAGTVRTGKGAADPDADRIPTAALPTAALPTAALPTGALPPAAGTTAEVTGTEESDACVCESSEPTVIDMGVLGKCEYSEKGWILVDMPRDAREAEVLSGEGSVPTHAVRILTGTEEENTREYKYLSRDWSAVYRSIPVTDVHVDGRSLPQLAQGVCRLLRVMPHRHAPMLPRVVLIGSRGSGASTQGELLSRKYRMVHVEFEEEMARVVLQDDNLSAMYRRQLMSRPDPELEAAILEKILLTPKCRNRGWVLTGYPTNIDQMRMMDLWATPPNRIIFLEVPAKECFIRLYYRKTDPTDGREYKLPEIEPFGAEGRTGTGAERERLMAHPRDDKRRIVRDIEEYFEEKEEMMKYCGETATRINGNKSVESVFELIDHVIISPAPAERPRDPLAGSCGVEEAHDRLRSIRTEGGLTINGLLLNPPDPIFKF